MEKRTLFLLITLFLFIGCKDEEDKREFPTVTTSAEIVVEEDGVYVQGAIGDGWDAEIIDYGFIYYLADTDGSRFSQVSLADDPMHVRGFSVKLDRGLKPGARYTFKAYAVVRDYTILGDEQFFLSKGGRAPIINDITPLKSWMGDTLTIQGDYFSGVKADNNIWFNNLLVHPFFSNDTILKVVIPYALESVSNTVQLEVGKKRASALEKFEVKMPEITEVIPEKVLPGESVTLKGQGLLSVRSMFVNMMKVPVSTINDSVATFSLPRDISVGAFDITLKVLNQLYNTNNSISIILPEIVTVTPTLAWKDSILTVRGTNLDKLSNFKIGWEPLYEVFKSDSIVKLRVGGPFSSDKLNARFYSRLIESELWVKLNMPVITSISPAVAYASSSITIKGERFFYDMSSSIGTIQYVSGNEAVVALPWDLTAGEYTVDLLYGNDISIGTVSFSVPEIKVLDYYPKQIQRGDTVSIVIENLPENLNTFFGCAFDDRWGDIVDRDGEVLRVTVPLNYYLSTTPSLTVFMGGQEEKVPNAFILDEKWEKVEISSYIQGGPNSTFVEAEGANYVVSNDQLYTVVRKFDPSTESWKQVDQADLLQYMRFLTSFSLGDELYLIAGNEDYPYGMNYKYSISDKTWTRIKDFPIPFNSWYEMFSFVMNGKAFVGNHDGFFQYEPGSDEWIKMETLPTSYHEIRRPLYFSYANAGYVAFHTQVINGVEYSEFWRYDEPTGKWMNEANLPLSFYGRGRATGYGDKVFITGKSYESGDLFIEYDPLTGESKQLMPAPHQWSDDFYSFSANGYFYFLETNYYGNGGMFKIPLEKLANIYK